MPPSTAFWSVTLYDAGNGFFIPNDRKKYSVSENAGMKLDDQGGIEVYIAAEKPEGVPEENWLPINRGDEVLDIVMRIYAPDVEKMKTWTAPTAERIGGWLHTNEQFPAAMGAASADMRVYSDRHDSGGAMRRLLVFFFACLTIPAQAETWTPFSGAERLEALVAGAPAEFEILPGVTGSGTGAGVIGL
ncbi:DUF1214 domain-containing protein [Pseudomonadota bacterium]